MATSSKSRVKASSSHSKASPAAASSRTRSTSRPLAEKDSRRAASSSKSSSTKHASTSSRHESSRYTDSKRGKSSKKADSDYEEDDDDESMESDSAEREKRSLLKKQKAQLRAQSPDEDLYQSSSSSSDSSSESDAIQVTVQAKRNLVPVVQIPAKSRSATSKVHPAPPVKSRTTAENQGPRTAPQSKPSPAHKRRFLDSDSVSPPPLRVQSSKSAKSPGERPKARPSAPSPHFKPTVSEPPRREKKREVSPPPKISHRSPRPREEPSPQRRPALQPLKQQTVEIPSDSDTDASASSLVKVVARNARKAEMERPKARPSAPAIAPAPPATTVVKKKKKARLPSPSDSGSDSDDDQITVAKSASVTSRVEVSRIVSDTRDISADVKSQTQARVLARQESDQPLLLSKAEVSNASKTASSTRSPAKVSAVSSSRRRMPSPKDLDSDSDASLPPPLATRNTMPREESHSYSRSPERSSHGRMPSRILASPSDDELDKRDSRREEDFAQLGSPERRRAVTDDRPHRTSPQRQQHTAVPSGKLDNAPIARHTQPGSPPMQTIRRDGSSPSEPPESYIGASAQIYIERTTMLRVAPQASLPSSRAIESPSSASRSRDLKHVSSRSSNLETEAEAQEPLQRNTSRSPSPKQSYATKRASSPLSDREQFSSLKGRKTTAPTIMAWDESASTIDRRPEPVKQSPFAASQSPQRSKTFQRLTRSSSDEDDTGDEAAIVKSVLTPPKRKSISPIRRKQQTPDLPGQVAAHLLPENSFRDSTHRAKPYSDPLPLDQEDLPEEHRIVDYEAEVEMYVDAQANRLQPSPLGSRDDSAEAEPGAEEDIPVPVYRSPTPTTSPQLTREEEPRFTATSRIISQPRRSKPGQKKRKSEYVYDLDIPVPYGDDGQRQDDSQDANGFSEEDREEEITGGSPKTEHFSLSKRARKATGGRAAVKREPSTRRRSKAKRDVESDVATEQPSSESDSFGDNGAIVSDDSIRSGYSDNKSQQRTSRRRKRDSDSPYERRKTRPSRSAVPRDDDESRDDAIIRKRRKVSSSRPEVVIEAPTSRRSSSIAVPNKPTRPSKSGISSNVRQLFEVNGSSRRKSLNERFSDEDTEESDIVEVMKSSTLEAGQSADAVLRAMSRESRERTDTSTHSHPDDGTSRRDKGKGRAVDSDGGEHDSNRLEGEGGADSDDSLPPPLQSRPAHVSSSRNGNERLTEPTFARMDPELEDHISDRNGFSAPVDEDSRGAEDFFADNESLLNQADIAMANTVQSPSRPSEQVPYRVEKLPRPQTNAQFLPSVMPQEVLDAVNSASSASGSRAQSSASGSRAHLQDRAKPKRGTTPVNGRRRRDEVDDHLDEDDEVIVKDSAIVKHPHGRMVRKEEMLELLAEHERNSKGKSRQRASSLEDAEGSIVDENEIAASGMQEDASYAVGEEGQREEFADLDMDNGSTLIEDPFDDDEIFNISIAKFEVQIEEILEDDQIEASSDLLEAAEGIVEEFEETFWSDEVELFVAQQLLERHRRRRSSHAPKTAIAESEEEMKEDADRGTPLAGTPSLNTVAAPTTSTLQGSTQEPFQSPRAGSITLLPVQIAGNNLEEVVREQSAHLSTEDRPSSAIVSDAVADNEMSPELAVPELPSRHVRRGSPSKVSPTKNRKSESPFTKQASRVLRGNGILQTTLREDEEETDIGDEPLIAPSVYIRRAGVPSVPMGSLSPSRETDLAEESENARAGSAPVATDDEAQVVARQERPSTPDRQSQPTQSHASSQSSQRKRKQANVYVEIQSPIRSSPARRNVERVHSSAEPATPESLPETRLDQPDSPTANVPGDLGESEENLGPVLNSAAFHQDETPALATAVDVDEPTSAANTSPSTRRASSHVEEINAMFEEELAGIAEALTEPEPEKVVSIDATIAASASPPLTTPPALLPDTATNDTTLSPSTLATQAATTEVTAPESVDALTTDVVEITTETTVEVMETVTVIQEAIPQHHVDEQEIAVPKSGSDSEAPSEQGVNAATVANAEGPSTSLEPTSQDQDSSSSSLRDSTSAAESENSDEGSDDAEGEDLEEDSEEDSEKPFNLAVLLNWANTLKDDDEPHLIGPKGALKLFEQMKLSTEGALPLLLAWKLNSQTKAECIKADFVTLLRQHEIDNPAKLSTYLTDLQTKTFAISSHVRFPSTSEDETETQPMRTWRVPEDYRSFYQFAFDYTKSSDDAGTLTKEAARNLWWIVLAPALAPGKDVVDFADSEAWTDAITKEAWLAMLDACTSANALETPDKEGVEDVQTNIVQAFNKWLTRRSSDISQA